MNKPKCASLLNSFKKYALNLLLNFPSVCIRHCTFPGVFWEKTGEKNPICCNMRRGVVKAAVCA